MRPFIRIKGEDILLTTDQVLRWCKINDGKLAFNITGCILMLLFIKAGSFFYPSFHGELLEDASDNVKSGWNAGYGDLPVHYTNQLTQTKPNVPTAGIGASLTTPKSLEEEEEPFIPKRRRTTK